MKVKKTVATESAQANPANAVSTSTETIQNCSGMTGAVGQMKTRAHTITAPTNDFNAHGNNIRIAIDYGDEHVQIKKITKNTYAFDNAAIGYLGRLSFVQVITAAYHEKRAQDKTTVRKSEFSFHSDGLSLLPQTVQPDNALAVATPYFTYDALGRVIRKDRPDRSTWIETESVYDDSQSDTNPRNRLSATSQYRVTTTGAVAPPLTTGYDWAGRAIRACSIDLNLLFRYQERRCNKFGQVDCVVENDYAATGPTHSIKTTFNTQGRVDVVAAQDDTRAKTIFHDRLNRLTDANAVGAYTAVIRCDDLGTITNRTSNPGLGDLSAYAYVSGTNRSRNSRLPGNFF